MNLWEETIFICIYCIYLWRIVEGAVSLAFSTNWKATSFNTNKGQCSIRLWSHHFIGWLGEEWCRMPSFCSAFNGLASRKAFTLNQNITMGIGNRRRQIQPFELAPLFNHRIADLSLVSNPPPHLFPIIPLSLFIWEIHLSPSWNHGEVPADWKTAGVTPLFKKGGRQKAGNYRPVSLTSVVGENAGVHH